MAMHRLIMTVGPYLEEEGWEAYIECLQLYFDVNNINAEKRLITFLSIIGSQTYSILKLLVLPTPSSENTLEQCKEVSKGHYCPKPFMILERFRFMKHQQMEGETVVIYSAQLKQLSNTCEFFTI